MVFPHLMLIATIAGSLFAYCKPRLTNSCPLSENLADNELTGSSLQAKQLSFSFESITDDSWPEIATFLGANDIKGTYFLAGKQLSAFPQRIDYLVSRGHLLGTVGWSGENLAKSSDPVSDLRRADFAASTVNPQNIFILRSSQSWNKDVAEELTAAGLGKYIGSIGMDIGWTRPGFKDDQECWSSNTSPSQCSDHYLQKIRSVDHGIVNFRSSSNQTLKLLQTIVPTLVVEGYKFVRVDEIPEFAAKISNQKTAAGSGCNDYK